MDHRPCRSNFVGSVGLVTPPVALTLHVVARILAEARRAEDQYLEPLRPGFVASPRTGGVGGRRSRATRRIEETHRVSGDLAVAAGDIEGFAGAAGGKASCMGSSPQSAPAADGPTTGPATEINGFAVASLVLGIVWIMGVGSILALVFGYIAKGRIDGSRGRETGRGMAIAGIVLGWVGVGLLVAMIVLMVAGVTLMPWGDGSMMGGHGHD